MVSSENVRQWALHCAYPTPQDFAVMLALKAVKLRQRHDLRMDDVTVTVVDLNIRHALFVQSDKCRAGVPKPVVDCGNDSADAFISQLHRDKCPLTQGSKHKNKHCIVLPADDREVTSNIRTSKIPACDEQAFRYQFEYKQKRCTMM